MTNQNLHSQIILAPGFANAIQPAQSSQWGNAEVLNQLLPQLVGDSDKKRQQLQKVDHYMLLETEELYNRLKRFCQTLGIDPEQDFCIARDGDGLIVLGDIPGAESLTRMLNEDLWFVDSFRWLQPNYTNLAHSFEVLEFSEYFERAPVSARRKYAHFNRADKGASFALRYHQGQINAQVETPVNVYCV